MRRRVEVGLADAEIDDRLAFAFELQRPVEDRERPFFLDAGDGGIWQQRHGRCSSMLGSSSRLTFLPP
jgi:hypothetical protein